MSRSDDVCGCFPTGRHYPGIAEAMARAVAHVPGLARELDAAASWVGAPFAVVDFETTGLDAATERVVEMAVVCFDGGAIVRTAHWLIDPERPIPPEASAVHGIRDEDVAGKPKFAELLPEILQALEGRVPVAYNAEFDRRFLHAEATRAGAPPSDARPPALRPDVVWIDPLVWVRELQKYEKGKKLSDVAQRMGIELDNAHRADADAAATGRVLLALAPQMPATYGELVRLQAQYAARQEADYQAWRSRRGS
jgi:DNA polymerase-3 subunit epsilon